MGKIIDLKNVNKICDSDIKKVVECIRSGGTVIFPTETVYGIGANALDKEAISKIFIAKGRPQDNPLIVHIANYNMLKDIVQMDKVTRVEKELMDAFWPGPFTIILPKKNVLPNNVTAGLDTVGVRMPDNVIALKLIELSGVCIAAPSANISGKPSGTKIEDILSELKDKVDYIIDAGNTDIGIESTVVKVIDGVVNILRPGKVTKEDIEKVVGKQNVRLDSKLFENSMPNEKVESPGMKHRHYAPNSKCVLVYSGNELNMIEKINKIVVENVDISSNKICILGFSEHKKLFCEKFEDIIEYIDIGSKNDLNEVSKRLFAALRQVDRIKCNLCIIEGVKKEGLGLGIMNRLIRACEYNYIEIGNENI
jgi:L-threonylcarbamoyladenylate synthase